MATDQVLRLPSRGLLSLPPQLLLRHNQDAGPHHKQCVILHAFYLFAMPGDWGRRSCGTDRSPIRALSSRGSDVLVYGDPHIVPGVGHIAAEEQVAGPHSPPNLLLGYCLVATGPNAMIALWNDCSAANLVLLLVRTHTPSTSCFLSCAVPIRFLCGGGVGVLSYFLVQSQLFEGAIVRVWRLADGCLPGHRVGSLVRCRHEIGVDRCALPLLVCDSFVL